MALAEEIGAGSAAARLGLKPDTLSRWLWKHANGASMSKQDPPERTAALLAEREIRRLKREVEELKLANTILREIARPFSKDRPDSGSKRSDDSSSSSPRGRKSRKK